MHPGRLIGKGKTADVFEYGDDVVKLYPDARALPMVEREFALMGRVALLDLPAPRAKAIVEIDGQPGLVMERAAGDPFASKMLSEPGSVPAYLETLAALHARVHAASGEGFPPLKDRLRRNIGRVSLLEHRDRVRMLTQVDALPDGERLCHGDFHPFNVLGTLEAPQIIDWLDAACGEPAADVARSFVILCRVSRELADQYVDAYLRQTELGREAVDTWIPVVAAARLAEDVPEENDRLLRMAGVEG